LERLVGCDKKCEARRQASDSGEEGYVMKLHLGKYARDAILLVWARERCLDAKRMIAEGRSPAIETQREKRRIKKAKSFGEFGEKRLANAPMAMRRSIVARELRPVWRNRLLTEITPDLRAHCAQRSWGHRTVAKKDR
jgi:hypothetical protein